MKTPKIPIPQQHIPLNPINSNSAGFPQDFVQARNLSKERKEERRQAANAGRHSSCLPEMSSLVCPGMFGAGVYGSSGPQEDGCFPWSEHRAPSGRRYYYNSATNVSTWDKPGDKQADEDEGAMVAVSSEKSPKAPAVRAVTSSRSLRGHIESKSPSRYGNLRNDAAGGGGATHGCLIDPRWGTKLFWDFFVMFVVLADALILPFQLAFKNDKQDGFDEFWFWWTTILFGIDIIANFNTAIQVDDDGSRPDALIRDRRAIALVYARGWFGIDFFSTVPWPRLVSIFAGGEEGGGSTQAAKLLKVVKFLRLMRLMRMLRMAKLRKLWERVEDEIGSVLLVQSMMLVRILVIVVAICHWSACIFWIVGSPESLITDLMPQEMAEEFAQVPHWTTIFRTHGPEQEVWRWVDRPTSESYIFCFYWTLGVMRTMPAEVTPVNLAERVFVLLFMFFALSAFAISVASLTQAYFKISERSRSFTDELFAVRMLMKKLKMDQGCRRKIKEFLALMFERRRIMAKEANLIKVLPQRLKDEVDRAKHLQHLLRLPGVSELSKGKLAEICDNCVELMDMCPGDEACRMNEVASAAWVLCAGRLQASDAWGEVMILGDESLDAVDEDCLWSREPVESPFTVSAYTACEMLRIDRDKFIRIASQDEVWKCESRKHNVPMAQKKLPNEGF
ncbi:eag, partial [Symbiodinium sp. KB8]